MKKPIGPGRPKLAKGEARTATIRVRVTENEKKALFSAASREKSPSEWARKKLLAGLDSVPSL